MIDPMQGANVSARGERAVLGLPHLKLVRAIVREGGITRAAVRLNLTQPALSHQLKDAEEKLGTRLFLRQGRRLVPTAAGERLVRAAEAVLGELGAAEEEIRGLGRGQEGLIRVSTECYTTYHWLPAALRDFETRYPGVAVEIVVEATRRPLAALVEGRLDVAIVTRLSRNREVACRKLFDDEMVVVMPPGHRLSALRFVPAEEIARETLLLYAIPVEQSDLFQRVLIPAGISPARLVRVELTEAILELVRAGQGIAVLARWSVAPDLASGRLVGRPLGPRGLRRSWYVATLKRHASLPHLADFASLIRGAASAAMTGRGRRTAVA
jgi:LysR family transcriptional regulator, regulator for metE and metH